FTTDDGVPPDLVRFISERLWEENEPVLRASTWETDSLRYVSVNAFYVTIIVRASNLANGPMLFLRVDSPPSLDEQQSHMTVDNALGEAQWSELVELAKSPDIGRLPKSEAPALTPRGLRDGSYDCLEIKLRGAYRAICRSNAAVHAEQRNTTQFAKLV